MVRRAPNDVAVGGLVRMLLLKILDQLLIQNVSSQDSRSPVVALPIDKALEASSMSVGTNDTARCIGESSINEARRR